MTDGTAGGGATGEAGRAHHRRRRGRALPAPPAPDQGLKREGLRHRLGRRRDLVLEPLPGLAIRLRGLHLPVSLLRGALQGLELEREVPRPAGDRALAEPCRRPSRSAQGHPVRHHDHQRPLRRGDRPLDCRDRRRRDHRRAVLGHLLRDALRAADRRVPRSGHVQGTDLPHGTLAQGADRLNGKRVGVVGIGATGIQVIQTIAGEVGHLKVFVRTPQYVLPMKNPTYGPAEVAAYKARFSELQADAPAHVHRVRVRLRAQVGRPHAGTAPRGAGGDLEDGSLKLWLASFGEMFFDETVNEEISEFVREKMRARLRTRGSARS